MEKQHGVLVARK